MPPPDGKYDTHFPIQDATSALDAMVHSVKKLHSSVFYRSFTLSRESKITRDDLARDHSETVAVGDTIFNQSVIGSATIILSEPNKAALLTSGHVVDFPDTLVYYFPESPDIPEDTYVWIVAYKIRQNNYITALPVDAELEIIALDSKLDVALLGTRFSAPKELPLPRFNYPPGHTDELTWGHVVYLAGYPLGHHMITDGMVSRTSSSRRRSFLIDASFNQGMSGGPVVAIRDGAPNFELVGLANAVAAESQYVLIPAGKESEIKMEGIQNLPYEGEIFTQLSKQIRYGVTFVVPIEDIIQFLTEHREILSDRGYDLSELFFSD